MRKLLALVFVFWVVFTTSDGIQHSGKIVHIEGDYTEDGTPMSVVWFSQEEGYEVLNKDLVLLYYDDNGRSERIRLEGQ